MILKTDLLYPHIKGGWEWFLVESDKNNLMKTGIFHPKRKSGVEGDAYRVVKLISVIYYNNYKDKKQMRNNI